MNDERAKMNGLASIPSAEINHSLRGNHSFVYGTKAEKDKVTTFGWMKANHGGPHRAGWPPGSAAWILGPSCSSPVLHLQPTQGPKATVNPIGFNIFLLNFIHVFEITKIMCICCKKRKPCNCSSHEE